MKNGLIGIFVLSNCGVSKAQVCQSDIIVFFGWGAS